MRNPWKLAFFSLILILGIGGLAFYLGKTGILSINIPKSTPVPIPSAYPVESMAPKVSPTASLSDEELIKEALYKKFGSDKTQLLVTINQLTAKHAKGLVREVEAVGGGYFIAAKVASGWLIVYDGQAHPTCEQIAPYDFPKDMVPECLNASGTPISR